MKQYENNVLLRRQVALWGAIASIVGLFITAISLVFSKYPVLSLLSLLLFETALICVWWYYQSKVVKRDFPYKREDMLRYERYIFEDRFHIICETLTAIKITEPYLTEIPIKGAWSGRGEISVSSPLHHEPLPLTLDSATGEFIGTYPLLEPKRFGDTAVVYYQMDLKDKSKENKPYYGVNITLPTGLLIIEVQLKQVKNSSPAVFGYYAIEPPRAVPQLQGTKRIKFDVDTRSYRVVIPNPIIGRSYRLEWEFD